MVLLCEKEKGVHFCRCYFPTANLLSPARRLHLCIFHISNGISAFVDGTFAELSELQGFM